MQHGKQGLCKCKSTPFWITKLRIVLRNRLVPENGGLLGESIEPVPGSKDNVRLGFKFKGLMCPFNRPPHRDTPITPMVQSFKSRLPQKVSKSLRHFDSQGFSRTNPSSHEHENP